MPRTYVIVSIACGQSSKLDSIPHINCDINDGTFCEQMAKPKYFHKDVVLAVPFGNKCGADFVLVNFKLDTTFMSCKKSAPKALKDYLELHFIMISKPHTASEGAVADTDLSGPDKLFEGFKNTCGIAVHRLSIKGKKVAMLTIALQGPTICYFLTKKK